MPLFATALALLLPSGSDRWVGLLLSAPDEVAGSYDEVSDAGYARVAHDAWTDVDNGDARLGRRNNGAVVFAALAGASTIVTHWGIFDAVVAGNLLAAGPVLNGGGVAQPATIPAGDQPRFNDGDIMLLSSEAVV